MTTYRLTVAYDGTDFSGSQRQPHARTVLGALEDAVLRVTSERVTLTASGRTDAGAHAHGLVAGCSLERVWRPERLRLALNAVLPDDVVITDAAVAASPFDARRDAIDRTYRYAVVASEGRSPVTRRHAWTVRGPLDVTAMREAATQLEGTHDFGAFGAATRPGGTTVRTVHGAAVTTASADDDDGTTRIALTTVDVRADAFLRGMMRSFAGALVRVGQGRATPAWIGDLVAAGPPRSARVPVAPAHGLHQWSVTYAGDTHAVAA